MASEFFKRFQAGDYAGALDCAQALPNGLQRDRDMGTALVALRRNADAVQPLKRAVASAPDQPEIWRNLGLALERNDQPEAAYDAFSTSASLAPQPRLTAAMARCLAQIGDTIQAQSLLEHALTQHDDPVLKFQLAQILLTRGAWSEAWPLYEARHHIDTFASPASDTHWDGKHRNGEAIILVAEQGAGDAIQFCRFALQIIAKGQPVILKVPKHMVALLSTLHPKVVVIPHDKGIQTPGWKQVWAPMLSVPGLLGITPGTVPSPTPYLHPKPRSGAWEACLSPEKLNIGIAWQGNPAADLDAGRSAPLNAFASLAALDSVNLIALQVGHGTEQIPACGFADSIAIPQDFDTGPDAFLDTAALVQRLDLVVTTDTAIAHLAGALGRPTCLALRKHPEWRWLQDRNDSPWYPSMRLFRQQIRGDWNNVAESISGQVATLAKGPGSGTP